MLSILYIIHQILFYNCLHSGHWLVPDIIGEGPPPSYNFTFTPMVFNRALYFGGNTPDGRDNSVYIAECTKTAVVSTVGTKLMQ